MRKGYLIGSTLVLLISIGLAACAGAQTPSANAPVSRVPSPASGAKPAGFIENPIGDAVQENGLNISAVYFQPVEMEPAEKAGLKPGEADIHLEADIHALKNNETGFGFGEWVPYLTIKYTLKNLDNGQEQQGTFMPMSASDGPHYGINIKMTGAGKYHLTFAIDSPEKQGFLLHVDKETGVPGRFWRKPIEVSWDFNYLPRKL